MRTNFFQEQPMTILFTIITSALQKYLQKSFRQGKNDLIWKLQYIQLVTIYFYSLFSLNDIEKGIYESIDIWVARLMERCFSFFLSYESWTNSQVLLIGEYWDTSVQMRNWQTSLRNQTENILRFTGQTLLWLHNFALIVQKQPLIKLKQMSVTRCQ